MNSNNNKTPEFLNSQYKVVQEKVSQINDFGMGEDYVISDFLGEGAQKKVYKVYDSKCSRFVAMGILKSENEKEKSQFLREAKLTAVLQHPNIMPVYTAGLNKDDQLFFTMKLTDGQDLKEYLEDSQEIHLQEKLNIFMKICDAVVYAHSKGVIHRDVKVENVYIGEFGEVLLCDWGLANIVYANCDEELLDDESLHDLDLKVSLKGQIKGTPGYIAPEIISETKYSFQSDIFALGAVLHFILTGKTPVSGKSSEEVIKKTEKGLFNLFPTEEEGIASGLKSICSKALKFELDKRYLSVEGMIADLKAFTEGFAPKAEDASTFTQLKLLYKRNQSVCNLSFAFIMFIIVLVALFIKSISDKEQQASTLLSQLQESDSKRQKMEADLVPVYLEKAQNALLEGKPQAALAISEVTYNFDKTNKEVRDVYGKSLMSMQMFSEAVEVLEGVNEEMKEIAQKCNQMQKSNKAQIDKIISYLQTIGPPPENEKAYVYRNILYEEFSKNKPEDKLKLLKNVVMMRNGLNEMNSYFEFRDGAYTIDLSNNPDLTNLFVLAKFGPAVVKKFDISGTRLKYIFPIPNLNLISLHMRNTPRIDLKVFNHFYEHLDAEGSNNDFSPFLANKPVQYLNIHKTPFKNYKVLLTLKKLKALIVTRGKLPKSIRTKLPKNCQIIEK